MQLHRTRRSGGRRRGLSLVEVAVSLAIISLVATASAGSLRTGLRSLTGAEASALATVALRQFREYTLNFSIEEMDALDGMTTPPLMGDGEPLPGAETLQLGVSVTPVSDSDPNEVVAVGESKTRYVKVLVTSAGRKIQEAGWLATRRVVAEASP